LYLDQPTQEELSKPTRLFDLREDRFDNRFPHGIDGLISLL
jgi:hypothetical protein